MKKVFFDDVKKYGYTDDYYPYAEKGLEKMRKMITFVFVFIILIAVRLAMVAALSIIPNTPKPDMYTDGSFDIMKAVSPEPIKWISFTVVKWIADVIHLISGGVQLVLVGMFIAYLIWYLLLLKKRWYHWERDVIANDWQAVMLRRALLNSLGIIKQFRDIQKTLKDKDPTHDQLSKYEALRVIKKATKVMINTRQAIDGEEIIKQYKVSLASPIIVSEEDEIVKMLKSISIAAAKVTKGSVSFGDLEISADRQTLISRGLLEVDDKYAYKSENLEVEAIKENYETSYPLSLLIDNTEKITAIKESAERWVNRTGLILDKAFATSKMSVQRIGTRVGNSTALFIYDLPFSIDLPYLEKLGKSLDSTFSTTGCDVTISEGRVLVTIPMPKKYQSPIDIKTMYLEAFGGPSD